MIVEINEAYILEDEYIIDHIRLLIALLENYHYIKYDDGQFKHLDSMMKKYGGTSGYELFQASIEFLSYPDRVGECITTVQLVELTPKEVKVLLFKPSELLVENSVNEWPIYERIIKAYQKDPTYGSVMRYVNRRKCSHGLVPANAGGKGNIPGIVTLKDSGEYQGMYRKKACVLFDRDTDNSHTFSANNNRLFAFFAGNGKNAVNMVDADVYKLDFGGGYIWHMWYKRAIENYFPVEKYDELGMNTASLPTDRDQYDYYHFKEPKTLTPGCYQKNMMAEMGKGLNYEYYQKRSNNFTVGGAQYSEMLLFLLKIAQIV